MIAIEFEQQHKSFSIGDSIRGHVRWTQLPAPPESLEIRLVWFTKGKGDRDLSVTDTRSMQATQVEGQVQFEFPVPLQPYSFSGKLISLVWAVEAIFYPERESESVEIVIAPRGTEILLYRDEGVA